MFLDNKRLSEAIGKILVIVVRFGEFVRATVVMNDDRSMGVEMCELSEQFDTEVKGFLQTLSIRSGHSSVGSGGGEVLAARLSFNDFWG